MLASTGCSKFAPATASAKTLTGIAASAGTASIEVRATQHYAATPGYSAGSTANVTSTATWTTSIAAVASMNASGLSTGATPGSRTITASLRDVSGTAALSVTAATGPMKTLTTFAVTPATESISVGATTLAETGVFTAGPKLNGERTYASAGGVSMDSGSRLPIAPATFTSPPGTASRCTA